MGKAGGQLDLSHLTYEHDGVALQGLPARTRTAAPEQAVFGLRGEVRVAMVRRSVDGSLVRVATRASRLSALRWALLMAAAALWLAMGVFKALVVAVPASVLVLVAMVWWICLIGRPVLELNPHGIVVRNLFRSWRIPWQDVSWLGEGWTIDCQGGGWAITICTCTPLSGVRLRDVPMEEKIRRKHGELSRNIIASRATRPARRRPTEIVEAIRTVANEHAVPVRFADRVGHESKRTGSRSALRTRGVRTTISRRSGTISKRQVSVRHLTRR